jgi:ankyrin repeat protein
LLLGAHGGIQNDKEKYLIAVPCTVDLRSEDGSTALQVAQEKGHIEVVTLLRKMQEMPIVGRRVLIVGLVAKPELNGRTGTALSFDDDKGRYSVKLDESSSSMLIKPCNLLPQVCGVCSV